MDPVVGLNPEQMHHLAATFDSAAGRLDLSKANVSIAVANAWWSGTVADRFRAAWAAAMIPKLSAASATLSMQSVRVRRQAADQVRASAHGGGLVAAGVPSLFATSPASVPEMFDFDALDTALEVALAGILSGVEFFHLNVVTVSSYIRANGTLVDEYVRFAPGMASKLKPLFGTAASLDDLAKFAAVAQVVTIALAGIVELWESWGNYAASEIAGRVLARVGMESLVALGAWAAAGAIGGPVGVAVGLAIGLTWIAISSTGFDEWVVDEIGKLTKRVADDLGDAWNAGADLAAGAWRATGHAVDGAVRAVGSAAGAAADAVGNVVGGARDAVGDALEAVLPW